MFRLAFTTDPHLNFVHQKGIEAFCRAIVRAKPDALVITGDISEAPYIVDHLAFLAIQMHEFPIFFVCGNHDFYNGSVVETRGELEKLFTYPEDFKRNLVPQLGYLSTSGVVPLTEKVALVGHDGWYDGGYANWFRSTVVLNDYYLIREFVRWGPDRNLVFNQLNEFAAESAAYVFEQLTEAFKTFDHVFVATHVSPFRENSVYNGVMSDDNWMPHFSSKQMGVMLLTMAEKHPEKQITVLCGHSHGQADNQILPNLRCVTGKARYRHPKLNKVFEL
jgi:3',5'-cyclic AMP phosphodiesterase CpdA